MDRKEKRDKVRDLNRPNLCDNNDTTIYSSETDWMEEVEECEEDEKSKERHSNTLKQHDQSLEYIKTRENFRKRQHKMRRRSFTNNRRSSISKNHDRISRISSDDWDKYKSCASLRSESSTALNLLPQTPIKSYTRNFIDTHFDEYNRISDYFVDSKRHSIRTDLNDRLDDNFWSFNFKDVQKPFPLIVIVMLTVLLIANMMHNFTTLSTF